MSILASTYAWALDHDPHGPVDIMQQAVTTASYLPLIAVGSGGSMTAAAWLAHLHRDVFRTLAHTSTPLQLASVLPLDGRVSVWLLSASGGNTDILRGLETAILAEPRHLVTVCAVPDSPLEEKARTYPWTTPVGFSSPAGRDGFLASNSLFATCTLFARCFLEAAGLDKLPDTLDCLLDESLPAARDFDSFDAACAPLWQRDTLLVLHGNAGHVAAIDIEARFTEAALGNAAIADYRNFIHDHHLWLAERSATCAVLAIVEPGVGKLAQDTLQLLPADIPVVRVELTDDSVGSALSGIYLSLRLAESAGRARGIDPGRLSVPAFGYEIYHLQPPRARRRRSPELSDDESVAMERKIGVPLSSLRDGLDSWRAACSSHLAAVKQADIRALVMDYDGTLVTTSKRSSPPEQPVVAELVRLLELGVPLGIATGRGGSVRDELQQVIPQALWPRVLIGYCNGAALGTLDQNDIPGTSERPGGELAPLVEVLESLPLDASWQIRPGQISVMCTTALPEGALWAAVMEALDGRASEARVVRSSHSVDILAPGVSKRVVVEHLARQTNITPEQILRIGDRGRWPGNDFELLDHPLGLSVDEVSSRRDACWNFAHAGERGVLSTVRYLRALTPASKRNPGRLRLRLKTRSA